MIDLELLRKNPEVFQKGAEQKGVKVSIPDILHIDEEYRAKLRNLEKLRHEQNELAKKRETGDRAKEIKKDIKSLEKEVEHLHDRLFESLASIPNPPEEGVPEGESESQNVVLREVGKKPSFDFKPKDHADLGVKLGMIDFESGAKVTGSGFYYLKNDGVRLELALVRYALDFLAKKGFTLFLTPDLARERFYLGTGYAPKGAEAQTYVIEGSDLGLIATAEVTLAGIHADEILDEKNLPLLYAGYSHCFRQEGGSYGKYSKGIYRVHQFTKVEMFAYVLPEDSEKIHKKFLRLEEELWQEWGIPYRVLDMCAGDLGNQAARKYDLEAWMPGRGDWGEVTSTSNTTDFQARRLSIRVRRKDGGLQYVHTINGTAFATSRAFVSILENYQTKEGGIIIPEVLKKYM